MSEKERNFIWLLVVLVVLVGIIPLLMWGLWGGWYMSGMMGMTGYEWGFMFLISIAFLVLLALGVYYLLAEFTRTGKSESSGGERALEILKERYAKGEITRDQYFKMKEEMES